MTNTNITNFRNNLFKMLDGVIKWGEPLNVSTKSGNAVVLSEEEYRGLIETMYIDGDKQAREAIFNSHRRLR